MASGTILKNLVPFSGTALAQTCGSLALGGKVCRDLGPEGFYIGTVTAYRRERNEDFYTVVYTQGGFTPKS